MTPQLVTLSHPFVTLSHPFVTLSHPFVTLSVAKGLGFFASLRMTGVPLQKSFFRTSSIDVRLCFFSAGNRQPVPNTNPLCERWQKREQVS